MNALEDTKYIMSKYNVHPKKNLGQNFLIDDFSLNKIVENVNKDDEIIEIGPGLGTLTAILAEKSKRVICVELDARMVEILKDRFKLYSNVEIINKDILKINISELSENTKVVANLPYYITSQIIKHLIKSKVKDITILVQKEVAERICAKTGTREAGSITYFTQYYADCEIKGIVNKECFIPRPEVDSSILYLKRLNTPRYKVNNEELLFDIIRTNFSKRRKTFINSASSIINKNELNEILNKLNISVDVRGENLTLKQYVEIVNLANNIICK